MPQARSSARAATGAEQEVASVEVIAMLRIGPSLVLAIACSAVSGAAGAADLHGAMAMDRQLETIRDLLPETAGLPAAVAPQPKT
ncbi:hypothetical protein BH24PSE2_BH24PSE2_14860 [soil metagenome]